MFRLFAMNKRPVGSWQLFCSISRKLTKFPRVKIEKEKRTRRASDRNGIKQKMICGNPFLHTFEQIANCTHSLDNFRTETESNGWFTDTNCLFSVSLFSCFSEVVCIIVSWSCIQLNTPLNRSTVIFFRGWKGKSPGLISLPPEINSFAYAELPFHVCCKYIKEEVQFSAQRILVNHVPIRGSFLPLIIYLFGYRVSLPLRKRTCSSLHNQNLCNNPRGLLVNRIGNCKTNFWYWFMVLYILPLGVCTRNQGVEKTHMCRG